MIVDELKFHWQYDGMSVICVVTAKDGTTLTANSAHAGKHDQFCREKGRRLSLTRALKAMSEKMHGNPVLQKSWRAKVWEHYRAGMTKRPRWNTATV